MKDLTAPELQGLAAFETALAAPKSVAARFEMIMELARGMPIHCDCDPDCRKIVGYTDPLITMNDAKRLLNIPTLDEVPK